MREGSLPLNLISPLVCPVVLRPARRSSSVVCRVSGEGNRYHGKVSDSSEFNLAAYLPSGLAADQQVQQRGLQRAAGKVQAPLSFK